MLIHRRSVASSATPIYLGSEVTYQDWNIMSAVLGNDEQMIPYVRIAEDDGLPYGSNSVPH